MHILYMDESGTSQIPGNTSHFILAGISIPITYWKGHDQEIEIIKKKYHLENVEMHLGWILRPYLEQKRISDFDTLSYTARRSQVERWRISELLRLQRSRNPKQYQQTKINFKKTSDYIHLTYDERKAFVREVAAHIGQWGVARLFAECIDKTYFDPNRTLKNIDEQCFEQVVSRFEQYLESIGFDDENCCGLLVHDNNETVAKKHTLMMRGFHQSGTTWTKIPKIIETPLFVDSQLTSMVQIADLCAYSLRRYLENHEEELFDLIFPRADRRNGIVVGVRHFTNPNCTCKICTQHRMAAKLPLLRPMS
jgi:hypothetical protein